MKIVLATAAALTIGLGTSGTANAQILYNYSLPSYGGVQQNSAAATPFGLQSSTNFYSPFFGYMGVTSGNLNTLYSRGSYSTLYSPFTGLVSQTSATYGTPFGPINYNSYYSPYTGLLDTARFANSTNNYSNTTGTNSNARNRSYYGYFYGNPSTGFYGGIGSGTGSASNLLMNRIRR